MVKHFQFLDVIQVHKILIERSEKPAKAEEFGGGWTQLAFFRIGSEWFVSRVEGTIIE